MEVSCQLIKDLREANVEDARQSLQEVFDQFVHQAVEQALRSLPGVINSLAAQAAQMQEATGEFYRSNPDLIDHKPLVAKTLEQLEAEHPGLTIQELTAKLVPEVRSKLKNYQKLSGQEEAKPSLDHLDHLAGMLR